jgi:peptidylprolyl isomerase
MAVLLLLDRYRVESAPLIISSKNISRIVMSKIVFIVLAVVVVGYLAYSTMQNKKVAAKNKQDGEQFLQQNGAKDGVQTTSSGLQYQRLTQGTGVTHPKAHSKVTVHYHGTLTDGTIFDSSVDRGEPITFGLNQVIPGWTEGVQLMVEGEKTRFFIPSNLGYGDRSAGKIPPGSVLIFDVEWLAIK